MSRNPKSKNPEKSKKSQKKETIKKSPRECLRFNEEETYNKNMRKLL